MQYLITILLAFVVSVGSLIGAYNYAPLEPIKLLTPQGGELLGTSLTTIQSSDTLKNSRTTINDNFTALNAGKIENASTSLPLLITLANLSTVGTITTGSWNATAIPVSKGGTGTTTPTSNQVMIGDGTSGLKVIGFGTNGQFLTSAGDGITPSWTTSAINEAGAYNWTGLHSFSATTTHATSTFTEIKINNIDIDETKYTTLTTASTSDASALHYHPGNCATGQSSRAVNTTGTQTITHNLGSTPSYYAISAVANTTQTSMRGSSYGTATDTTNETCTYSSLQLDGTGQTFGQNNAAIIHLEDANSTDNAIATLSAITATTFTINWTTNTNSGGTRYFQYVVCK